MTKIFKYPIRIEDNIKLMMPMHAKILCVQLQGGVPCIWALVDEDMPLYHRIFNIYGTGHPISNAELLEYIGTFQIDGGSFVFHLFEQKENS